MQRLRVGVIGLGTGKRHVTGYRQHAWADVVAVADRDPARRAFAHEQLGVPSFYESGAEMLERANLDVVSIATPNNAHRSLALSAFAVGCHVLCEKPMALNAAEGQEMVDAARRAGKRLMVNMTYRFHPQSRLLKREMDAGLLGKISFARSIWHRRRGVPASGAWFTQRAVSGGGPLIDLGVHRIDLPLWLMGFPEPQWVLAGTYRTLGAERTDSRFDVEDLAVAMIRLANGVTLAIETSWTAHMAERELIELRLLGDRGGLLQRNRGESFDDFTSEVFSEREGRPVCRQLTGDDAPATSAMHHFIESIVAGRPHTSSGEESVTVLRMIDAIYLSAESGEPVPIEPAAGR